MTDSPICAFKMSGPSSQSPRLGGPRYVCGKPLHHEGDHGSWRLVSQLEHAQLIDRHADGPKPGFSPRVEEFIEALRALPEMQGVFNPWRDLDSVYDASEHSALIRASNLRMYLTERLSQTKMILIGEAPGYRGCKFSGIAMTSERILLGTQAKIPPDAVFHGPKSRTSTLEVCPKGFIEPTASIVWSLLLGLNINPREFLLWNAFPCHPFKSNLPLTNRKPSPEELQKSAHILRMLISMVPQAVLVAVGRVAEGALESLGLTYYPVRHPAMGGANDFRTGIKALLKQS